MRDIVKGFILTLVVSFCFLLVGAATGGSLVKWFFIPFFVQYVLFFIVNKALMTYAQIQINRMEVDRLNARDKNKTYLNCSVCGELNEVEIDINDTNEFVCEKCDAKNSVIVSITNALKTEMIYTDNNKVITEDMVAAIKEEDQKREEGVGNVERK